MSTITEEKALKLLGDGHSAETVAAACGVTASRISQLLSDEEFSKKVASLRYENLQKHNERDASYDSLEDSLLQQLRNNICLVQRPMEIAKLLQVVNAAKRRGSSSPDQVINQQTVVQLTIPQKIVQKFTTNINNQVIQAGAQELLTIASGDVGSLLAQRTAQKELISNSELLDK